VSLEASENGVLILGPNDKKISVFLHPRLSAAANCSGEQGQQEACGVQQAIPYNTCTSIGRNLGMLLLI
jgi:hypothetical protein